MCQEWLWVRRATLCTDSEENRRSLLPRQAGPYTGQIYGTAPKAPRPGWPRWVTIPLTCQSLLGRSHIRRPPYFSGHRLSGTFCAPVSRLWRMDECDQLPPDFVVRDCPRDFAQQTGMTRSPARGEVFDSGRKGPGVGGRQGQPREDAVGGRPGSSESGPESGPRVVRLQPFARQPSLSVPSGPAGPHRTPRLWVPGRKRRW